MACSGYALFKVYGGESGDVFKDSVVEVRVGGDCYACKLGACERKVADCEWGVLREGELGKAASVKGVGAYVFD